MLRTDIASEDKTDVVGRTVLVLRDLKEVLRRLVPGRMIKTSSCVESVPFLFDLLGFLLFHQLQTNLHLPLAVVDGVPRDCLDRAKVDGGVSVATMVVVQHTRSNLSP